MTFAAEPISIAEIAFVCAMPMELEPLIPKLELTETAIGGAPARRRDAG